jgi:hypothetical protein
MNFVLRLLLFVLLCTFPAAAQHQHAQGHGEYQDWASQKTGNCCNNDDCGTLDDPEVRETTTGTEIAIDGQWCPVTPQHYIIKGKSPDWTKAHACVQKKSAYSSPNPCERLLCYSGPGGV